MNNREIMLKIMTDMFDGDADHLNEYIENNSDIEIAHDLWDNTLCSEMDLSEVESEVECIRKSKSFKC